MNKPHFNDCRCKLLQYLIPNLQAAQHYSLRLSSLWGHLHQLAFKYRNKQKVDSPLVHWDAKWIIMRLHRHLMCDLHRPFSSLLLIKWDVQLLRLNSVIIGLSLCISTLQYMLTCLLCLNTSPLLPGSVFLMTGSVRRHRAQCRRERTLLLCHWRILQSVGCPPPQLQYKGEREW